MKKQKQNTILLKEALEVILSVSETNQISSSIPKISDITIAFHYTNGFTSLASIEKGKGRTIERNMELIHPENSSEESEPTSGTLLN